ncbi:MAG: aspartate-semialdehyde dehydrogenase [Candidatus Izimaplasma sp.]|nr:aspartate-semialdehyde dehydrogenase [Candidatus Izimaplasma bacterium]
MKQYTVAIVGVTGLVGQTFLEILNNSNLPIKTLRLFASSNSVGTKFLYKDTPVVVEAIEQGVFETIDYALFSINSSLSKRYAKQAVTEGCKVIDNSSAFRFDDTIPLVVPSINLDDVGNHHLIANPNCSTIQSVIPLSVINEVSPILNITYTTYQSVSGSGQKGVEALHQQSDFYPVDIRQTVYPKIDTLLDDGYTFEERKMIDETKKILHNNQLLISATCVRVPIERGHAVSIRVVTKQKIDLTRLKDAFQNHPMIVLTEFPNTVDVSRKNSVSVGRIRRDKIDKNGLLLFVSADNLYVGAAQNAVDILKGMIEYE